MTEKTFMAVEDLDVYRRLCQLHLEVCEKYLSQRTFQSYRERYSECIRMLNGLEKTLEKKLPPGDRRWHVAEGHAPYGSETDVCPPGWPTPET